MKSGITLQAINTFGIPLSKSYFHIILKKILSTFSVVN